MTTGSNAKKQKQEEDNLPEVKVEPPRSLAIAKQGIKQSSDFASLMSALMSDLIEGKINPNIANATCNAGGKLLKMVDMQMRYGMEAKTGGKVLTLVQGE